MASITNQAKAIYRLLSKKEALTAREISTKLGILPNAVYRSIKVLIQFDFVQEVGKYPVKFIATPSTNAAESYLQSVKENLSQDFFPEGINNKGSSSKDLGISFIKNRDELLEKTNTDMQRAKIEVNFIVSGLEVPAETILGYKRAIEKGVRIRILVQRLDETSKEMLCNWQKIGVQVKFFPLLEARIIIFDQKVAYITSYSPDDKNEGIGVRFQYPPVARLMNDLFEQRWKIAKEPHQA